jgi:hypothetical protein
MATRFIDKEYGTDSTTAIANDATGLIKVRNLQDAAGLAYDSVDNVFKFNGNDAVYSLVDTASTQTITGDKTFTGTVVMSGSATKTEFADGTVSLPSITFDQDLNTGIYRIGADNIGVATNGAKVLDVATTGLTVTGSVSVSNAAGPTVLDEAATSTNPTLIPDKAETDTGIGWASDTLHVVLGGANAYAMAAASLSPGVTNAATLGTSSLMWGDLFLASGGVINFDNSNVTITHGAGTLSVAGPIVTFDSGLVLTKAAIEGFRIADWVGSGAIGSAVPFSAAQNIYADGQLDIVGVYGESSSDLTSAFSAKCGRFRHLVHNAAGTVAHETYGAVGQLVTKNTTLTHLHAGVMGTFEGNTTGSTLNSSYLVGHAAVMARIGGHNKITATTPPAGFLAFNNQSAAITGGNTHAFATSMYSATYPWSTALYVPTGSASKLFEGVIASVPTTKFGSSLYVTQTTGQSEGLCAYFDGTVAGTPAGHTYNVGSWINLASGSVPGASAIMTPIETGVYDGGATLTNARVVFGGTHQAIFNNGAPGASLHCWRLNSTVALTALIQAGNAASVAYQAGTGTGVAAGYITFFTSPDGPGTGYIKVYSATSGG